jgi:hypothetical protein
MRLIRSHFAWLVWALLPTFAHAAGYKFTTFAYPAAGYTVLTGIDDANRVTGYVNLTDGSVQGFFVTAAGSLAAVNPPGFVYAAPTAISRYGGIVGTAFDGSNYSLFQDGVDGYGALSGLLIDQSVSGINSSLDIVGNYTTGKLQNAAYARIKGTYHKLLPAKCSYTHDPAINDGGVVVGNCVNSQNASLVFTWSKGKFTYFTPPPAMTYVQATGINSAGVVAGWYIDASGFDHGFVLDGSTFTTVDNPASGAYNTQINGINKAGKLVGTYYAPAGQTSFIATPQ